LHNSLLHLLLKNGDFLNTHILQGSVATRLGCGGVFVYDCVTNFLLSLTVKEFWKSANIWWSYGQELGVLFFWLTVYSLDYCNSVLYGMSQENIDKLQRAQNILARVLVGAPWTSIAHWTFVAIYIGYLLVIVLPTNCLTTWKTLHTSQLSICPNSFLTIFHLFTCTHLFYRHPIRL